MSSAALGNAVSLSDWQKARPTNEVEIRQSEIRANASARSRERAQAGYEYMREQYRKNEEARQERSRILRGKRPLRRSRKRSNRRTSNTRKLRKTRARRN